MKKLILIPLLALGCSSAPATEPPAGAPAPGAPTPQLPAAPWSVAPLSAGQVPSALLPEWRKAENRNGCAPIAPASLGDYAGATPRAATFGGGWGIAWDLPGQRSAFGVAGAGVLADAPGTYDAWPYRVRWRDGSSAGYGPEGGGAGPKQVAYLRIAGQTCLYNLWSNVSREHLESLLAQLRFVRTD